MHLNVNTIYNYLYNYQNALQTHTPNTGFTRPLYSVHTARPQLGSGVYFKQSQNKRRRMAFCAIAERAHSVAGNCTARLSAICIFNAVETLS